MSGDGNPFGELLQDYLLECLPLAEQVTDAFVELERRWRDGDPAEELLASLSGPLHTVKGNSAMMGLAPMREIAHALEDACGLLRRDQGRRTDAAGALLVEGGGMLVDHVRHASPELDPQPSARFVERVRELGGRGRRARRRTRRPSGAAPTGGGKDPAGAGAVDTVVRVDFRRLDALLEVLGEGLIQHSALVEAYRGSRAGAGARATSWPGWTSTVIALEKTLKRLESTLMETRLLPIATVFGRVPADDPRHRPGGGEAGPAAADRRRDAARQGGARPAEPNRCCTC